MSGPTDATRSPLSAMSLGLLCAALAGACRGGAELRPVVRAAPIVTQVIVTEISRTEGRGSQVPTSGGPPPVADRPGPAPLSLAQGLADPGDLQSRVSITGALLGSAAVQLDPGLGPIDLGYPLLVDLGAGDAPYDDGVPTIHVDEPKRGGFSDSVIQVTWRERLSSRVSLHGGAAIFRYQDLGILDSLPDSRFGFAVVGIQFRL